MNDKVNGIIALKSQTDNNVWALSPVDYLSFKARIDAVMNDAFTIGEATEDDTTDDQGRFIINVNGVLVRGTGLPQSKCDMLNICELDNLDAQLKAARDNPDCKAIVMLFNSPGGTVHAHSTALLIQSIAQKISVIGYADAMCCSAAYQLAAMCSEFYVSETAWAGFVGTIYTRADQTQFNSQTGMSYTFITSSPKKLYLNPNAKITDDEKEWIGNSVMYYYDMFKADVLSNREIAEEYLDSSIFIGQQAVDANFADGLINSVSDLLEIS